MSKSDTLKAHVPNIISQLREYNELYASQGIELDVLYSDINEILDQCFVSTATWGLKYWEKMLDIPMDETKDSSYRREIITSKIRGSGTVTAKLIENVAESYINGQVEIIEKPNIYSIIVRFIDASGIPPNLENLKKTLELIKPAHLELLYRYKYLIISEMDQIRIADLDTMTLNDFNNLQ